MPFQFQIATTGILSLAGFLTVAMAAPDTTGNASPWVSDTYSRLRLIAGSNLSGAPVRRAGIELQLQPGWKTYWRYPGDSGLPPRFDFTGSTNVKTATVLWPAPQRFTDGGGTSIGYHGEVIFPLRVTPDDPTKPALLRAHVNYAVCQNLCVPAEGRAEISLRVGASEEDAALTAAEQQVPQPSQIGAKGTLTIDAVRRDDRGPRPRVVVDVTAPPQAKVDLFAEGPTADWALPLPQEHPSTVPGHREFAFELDGLPPNAKADGAELTLTLVGPNRAIVAKTHLD